MGRTEHVGPVVAEELTKRLPKVGDGTSCYRLPDGTVILVGIETVYAQSAAPMPCAVDLGGEVPMVLFRYRG